ncbi:protein CHUP1, chloroplastic-like [Phragmites australis]|uniref:protein CHUP1, chloroplastic-like n=1 Tax=Phragmites australis TaxID=29695 RepID=UPI002D78D477|nr:protein CHUP1, chloroplastic-like [Phragmites australis]XP_062182341.1 protein CHUP1, chloroplastic-like [Phragmites australis]XP_062182342.1 protein CHUP1, chloroplastic-like [Phragmites australis]XP_062182343.1 protein CHUP1, chloroplastic-like [Phragmites australis]
MKQQVLSSNGHGSCRVSSSSPSPSLAAARTRGTSRPKAKQADPSPPTTPAPGVKSRPRTTTTTTTTTTMAAARRQLPVPAPVRRVNTKDKNKESETVEEEVVRLRGEVEAMRREVQRLLRLNADLQQHRNTQLQVQQSKAIVSSDLSRPPNPPPPPPKKIPGGVPAPPPPPPPPPGQQQRGPSRVCLVNKATALLDMYSSLTKHQRDTQRRTSAAAAQAQAQAQHSSIVDELQNRSTHLLAIKADVETKAEFINDLIKKVHTSIYTDVEQVVTFVDWLDQQLSTLSDETAILKHFNWPERKADALREAASEYRHLKSLVTDISSLNDDGSPTSCEATLRKISSLLDKLEKGMNRLVNLRSSVMPSYKELSIPTDWMLDSGIASKMRLASVNLAKMYMKGVLKELDSRDTAGNEPALVAQSVRFTYRVHQFAGGLDCEAIHAFEELRRRVRPISSP